MTNITISRIKPNPTGKDRTRHGGASVAQLGAEWVDIKNTSASGINLAGIALWHLAYSSGQAQPQKVVDLTGVLGGGQTLRIHSGQVRPLTVLYQEDLAGADFHGFTGSDNYTWNNDRLDAPGLVRTSQNAWIDRATYDANPPEGAILVRVGDKMVVASRTASTW
jgi:hypothetical protein